MFRRAGSSRPRSCPCPACLPVLEGTWSRRSASPRSRTTSIRGRCRRRRSVRRPHRCSWPLPSGGTKAPVGKSTQPSQGCGRCRSTRIASCRCCSCNSGTRCRCAPNRTRNPRRARRDLHLGGGLGRSSDRDDEGESGEQSRSTDAHRAQRPVPQELRTRWRGSGQGELPSRCRQSAMVAIAPPSCEVERLHPPRIGVPAARLDSRIGRPWARPAGDEQLRLRLPDPRRRDQRHRPRCGQRPEPEP